MTVAIIEMNQEIRPPISKKSSFKQKYKSEDKQDKKVYPVLLPFLCGIKKSTVLLEQWIKDAIISLPNIDQLPYEEYR